MHIWDGALSGSLAGTAVLGGGMVLTAAGTALGLYRMDYERVPRVAMLSSAFFVVSLIRVPLGLTWVHLVLNGLVGLVLGWAAFPALLIALLLQALFFGFGGLTTLGINTLNMALPAVVCYYVFHRALRAKHDALAFAAGLGAGATGFLLAALLVGGSLLMAGKEFQAVSALTILTSLPIALVEGLVTGSVVLFLRKVRPELLQPPLLRPAATELSHA